MGDLFGGLIGGAFQLAGSAMQADAVKDVAEKQIAALNQIRDDIKTELNPEKVQNTALVADIDRAKNRLALQAKLDPSLLTTRYTTQANIQDILSNPNASGAEAMANQLTSEISQPNPGLELVKSKLIDNALNELDAGATLPPDVQAELVKAGLERAGQSGVGPNQRGMAGQESRKLLGSAGLALKLQRQQTAVNLANAANDLTLKRAALLSSVFPQLKGLQTTNLGQQMTGLQTANAMTPEAGLGAGDVVNLLEARVGANNAVTSQMGNVGAQEAQGLGQAYQGMLGAGATMAKGASSYLWNDVFNDKREKNTPAANDWTAW